MRISFPSASLETRAVYNAVELILLSDSRIRMRSESGAKENPADAEERYGYVPCRVQWLRVRPLLLSSSIQPPNMGTIQVLRTSATAFMDGNGELTYRAVSFFFFLQAFGVG